MSPAEVLTAHVLRAAHMASPYISNNVWIERMRDHGGRSKPRGHMCCKGRGTPYLSQLRSNCCRESKSAGDVAVKFHHSSLVTGWGGPSMADPVSVIPMPACHKHLVTTASPPADPTYQSDGAMTHQHSPGAPAQHDAKSCQPRPFHLRQMSHPTTLPQIPATGGSTKPAMASDSDCGNDSTQYVIPCSQGRCTYNM